MPRTRSPYSAEFRQQIIELVRGGRTPAELAQEYEPTAQTISSWIRQAEIDDGERAGVTTSELEELRRLRRENRVLKEEREILKKAAAWFAAESESKRRRRSDS